MESLSGVLLQADLAISTANVLCIEDLQTTTQTSLTNPSKTLSAGCGLAAFEASWPLVACDSTFLLCPTVSRSFWSAS